MTDVEEQQLPPDIPPTSDTTPASPNSGQASKRGSDAPPPAHEGFVEEVGAAKENGKKDPEGSASSAEDVTRQGFTSISVKENSQSHHRLTRRNTELRMAMTMRKVIADKPPGHLERMKRMKMFALSRIAESMRFDFTDEELEEPLSKNVLLEVALRANKSRHSEPEQTVKDSVDKLWDEIEKDAGVITTFNDLLDIECPNFPETTPEQRARLKRIAAECDIVSKPMICRLFNVDENSQLIEFLFASGADALPGEVFQDIVGTLETHPYSLPFALDFSEHMVSSGRKMMTMIPFLILLISAMILLPLVANIAHHEMIRGVITVIDDDWANGCPDGPTAAGGCNFIQRNLNMVETIEFDALRYFRTELVDKLWQDDGNSAADTPVGFDKFTGSVFPIGALVLRLVPAEGSGLNPTTPCSALNLTRSTQETRIGTTFGCGAMWSAVIPFNATKAEAQAAAASATTDMPSPVGAALIAQFGTYEPTTGVVAYFKVTLSLPEGGHVYTRIDAVPVDYHTHEKVLPLLIINVLVFAMSLAFAIFYGLKGQPPIGGALLADFITLVLISVAYGMLVNMPEFDLYQIDYVSSDHDRAAHMYNVATRVLAFWVLFMTGLMARYLQEVGALYIVIAIIRYAALEIAALIVIFGFWTISFALMGQLFFGPIAPEFASSFMSFAFLFSFFANGGSYEGLASHHQVLGPIFWFFFSIFVTFLALNLLIAVLTAPLAEVKETCDLHIQMHDKVRIEVQMDSSLTSFQRQVISLKEMLLPMVTLLYDSSPNPRLKMFWLNLHLSLTDLCTVYQHSNPRKAMDAGVGLLQALDTPSGAVPFETRLVNNVNRYGELDEYSLAFTLQSIAAMSTNELVRDSRLEKALMMYDIHTTNTNKLQEKQAASREVARELSKYKETSGSLNGSAAMNGSAVMNWTFSDLKQDVSLVPDAVRRSSAATAMPPPKDSNIEETAIMKFDSTATIEPSASGVTNPFTVSSDGKDTSPLVDNTQKSDNGAKPAADGNGTTGEGFSQAVGAEAKPIHAVQTSMEKPEDASANPPDENEIPPPAFEFTRYLLKRQRERRTFAVNFLVIAVVFGWFFGTGLSRNNDTAFLVQSVREGLVKFPIVQSCDDAACSSAMSFRKGFEDTDNLPEWEDWMIKVFRRQMFSQELNLASHRGVFWDRRMEFRLPINIRQVRAVEKECELPAPRDGLKAAQRRQIIKDGYKCTKRHEFQKTDMVPLAINTSLASPNMFKFTENCPERRDLGYWGFFESLYPCEGFVAQVNNVAELDHLLQVKWINNMTRMIAITVTFVDGDAEVEFTLFTGVGGGGAAAHANGLATAISENHSELVNMLVVVSVCLCLDAIIGFGSYVWQHFTSKEKVPLPIGEIFPVYMIVYLVLVFIIPYIFYPKPAFHERIKLQLGLASLCLTYLATITVFFPIAGLFSKQATLLFNTLGRSARQIALIVPFYIIFVFALSYSGLLLFSTRSDLFSSFRFAILTVARGALGDFDKESLAVMLPEMAEIYNIIFYAVVLIMLANLVLAMVTSAATDALGVPLSVELGERVCSAFGWHVAYGTLVEFVIAWNVYFLRRSNSSASDTYREMSTIATGDGNRLPYLSETLCTTLGPNRANDILTQLRLDSVASFLYPSAMLWILEEHSRFQTERRIDEAMDDEKEQEMLTQYASPQASFQVQSFGSAEEAMGESKGSEGALFKPRPSTGSREVAPTDPLMSTGRMAESHSPTEE